MTDASRKTIELREVASRDAERVARLIADPEIRLWNPFPSCSAGEWIESVSEPDEASATFAIAAGNRLLGTASLFNIDHSQQTAELGYRVLARERGKGIATQALQQLAVLGFEHYGLRRLQLFHAVDNPASCTVAERCGFHLEGRLLESYVYGDGIAHDEHLHARLVARAT